MCRAGGLRVALGDPFQRASSSLTVVLLAAFFTYSPAPIALEVGPEISRAEVLLSARFRFRAIFGEAAFAGY